MACFGVDIDHQFAIEDSVFEQSIRVFEVRKGDVFDEEELVFPVDL
jgi:hypothetical protein